MITTSEAIIFQAGSIIFAAGMVWAKLRRLGTWTKG